MTPEQRTQVTYDAFNERDETTALAGLAADVQWDDGAGHVLVGKQAVLEHWREQWRSADTRIRIDSMQRRGPELILRATLETNQPDGGSTSRAIRNTLLFSDDRISSMKIG
jgi:hypothetical protein